MEIVFWLQPIFFGLGIISAIVAMLSFFAIILIWAAKEFDNCSCALELNKLIKKLIILCVVSICLFFLSAPIADAGNVYKNILIYRGINSAVADKAASTAEKALDVLNQKLNAELKETVTK